MVIKTQGRWCILLSVIGHIEGYGQIWSYGAGKRKWRGKILHCIISWSSKITFIWLSLVWSILSLFLSFWPPADQLLSMISRFIFYLHFIEILHLNQCIFKKIEIVRMLFFNHYVEFFSQVLFLYFSIFPSL